MSHAFKLGNVEHLVDLSRCEQGYRLHQAGEVTAFTLQACSDGRAVLVLGDARIDVVLAVQGDDVFVHLDGEAYQLRYQHPLDRLAAQDRGAAEDRICAPMPGSIVAVSVAVGDAVRKGQTLLVMESMKMETTIAAPRDGVIESVSFEKGQTFDRDALLIALVGGGQP